ncbi:hypothetical protein BJX64DRAFT_226687 [Aspergillus heterothallicus]
MIAMSPGQQNHNMFSVPYEDFIRYYLPGFHRPLVKITIGDAAFEVSRSLICQHSPYFAAMFNGNYKESEQQSAVLTEIEGVLSVRSFKLFLQRVYTGTIKLGDESPEDQISALIEFARLADMLDVANMDIYTAAEMRSTIDPKNSLDFIGYASQLERDPDANIGLITPSHIRDATCLPKKHEIRTLLAKASVEAYLTSPKFKFAEEIEEVPEFAADLLKEVNTTVKTFTCSHKRIYFTDPRMSRKCVLS